MRGDDDLYEVEIKLKWMTGIRDRENADERTQERLMRLRLYVLIQYLFTEFATEVRSAPIAGNSNASRLAAFQKAARQQYP